jgi:UDPglucose--hexose-1-phosphate uridylyltransferase
MRQLRKDVTSGRWVIIASERSKRPDDFRKPKPEAAAETAEEARKHCPFCMGNESQTPPEVFALRAPDTGADQPDWRVRVVANKFPALVAGAPPSLQGDALFPYMEGIGVHEVVIENPVHQLELADLSLPAIRDVLLTYRERMRMIESEPPDEYIHLFKNKGNEAGASLSHPHSQIIATPIIPKKIAGELDLAENLHREFGECIFCRIIREECRRGERIVHKNDKFCVLVPFAPRFPFETRIYPLRHSAFFTGLEDEELDAFAPVLKNILLRLKAVLSDPPYNFYVYQAPNKGLHHPFWPGLSESFHWHMEIIPVLTKPAGFELGTGFYINPVAPEAAASFLRSDPIDR